MIKAIIGLGNPGTQYAYTRHNIGFRVVDALAERYGAIWRKRNDSLVTTVKIDDHDIELIKPQTFMNSSGRVIPALLRAGVKPENICVVHDELELPFGKVAHKVGGSAKGHNGLKSIIEACGQNFHRIRCGIGRPEHREDVPDYVLKPFAEPAHEVDDMIASAVNSTIELNG